MRIADIDEVYYCYIYPLPIFSSLQSVNVTPSQPGVSYFIHPMPQTSTSHKHTTREHLCEPGKPYQWPLPLIKSSSSATDGATLAAFHSRWNVHELDLVWVLHRQWQLLWLCDCYSHVTPTRQYSWHSSSSSGSCILFCDILWTIMEERGREMFHLRLSPYNHLFSALWPARVTLPFGRVDDGIDWFLSEDGEACIPWVRRYSVVAFSFNGLNVHRLNAL